jgi:hypothetical protein
MFVRRLSLSSLALAAWSRCTLRLFSWRAAPFPFFFVICFCILLRRLKPIMAMCADVEDGCRGVVLSSNLFLRGRRRSRPGVPDGLTQAVAGAYRSRSSSTRLVPHCLPRPSCPRSSPLAFFSRCFCSSLLQISIHHEPIAASRTHCLGANPSAANV